MMLARNCLRVRDVAGLSEFYVALMGMHPFGPADRPAFGYHRDQCLLEFHEGGRERYRASNTDLYWKIGITLQSLDTAVAYLRREGWAVSDPFQFRDIGYMCHLQDPEGFAIELLQQGFAGNDSSPKPGHPIGAQATLAHITLRITDIGSARAYCEERLNMRLMSVQPVRERGFTLYFYGWSDEPLPNPNLESVENREWLWARPYTLLELQHLETLDGLTAPNENAAGFAGLVYRTDDGDLIHLPSSDLTAFC